MTAISYLPKDSDTELGDTYAHTCTPTCTHMHTHIHMHTHSLLPYKISLPLNCFTVSNLFFFFSLSYKTFLICVMVLGYLYRLKALKSRS